MKLLEVAVVNAPSLAVDRVIAGGVQLDVAEGGHAAGGGDRQRAAGDEPGPVATARVTLELSVVTTFAELVLHIHNDRRADRRRPPSRYSVAVRKPPTWRPARH